MIDEFEVKAIVHSSVTTGQKYAICPNCKRQISLHPNVIGEVSLYCPSCSEKFKTQGKK